MENSGEKDSLYDVIVIGGGASGMMAAGTAAARGKKVLLLEKNTRLGEKLRISGGGRCNILNKEEDERVLISKYGDMGKYLFSLFSSFGMKESVNFFEERGMKLKVEDRKRAFPISENATDVVLLLEKYMEGGDVEVKPGETVSSLQKENDLFVIKCAKGEYASKTLIVATGGVSHKETGSTGDGFTWLRDFGHTIITPTASLVPLAVGDVWVKMLSGVSLDAMKISFFTDGKKGFSEKGRLLFTHFGISGPLILNSSSRVSELLRTGDVTAQIDLYPSVDHGSLDKELITLFDEHKNKDCKNVLKDFLPEGLAKGLVPLFSDFMDTEKKVHSVTKEERKYLVQILKALPLHIEGLMGLDKAIVADGGVPCTEIDFASMMSKKVPNLYVTGDLLHIQRPSGGYSLQLCWSTGFVAGSAV